MHDNNTYTYTNNKRCRPFDVSNVHLEVISMDLFVFSMVVAFDMVSFSLKLQSDNIDEQFLEG